MAKGCAIKDVEGMCYTDVDRETAAKEIEVACCESELWGCGNRSSGAV